MNFFSCITDWGCAEPILGWFGFLMEFAAVVSAVVYFYKQRKAKRARYKIASSGFVWVVLQVGQPVAAAFSKQFGVEPDYIIDPEVDLGHLIIDGEKDYQKLVKKFRDILKANQDKEIRVITSGMTGLNALFGQAAGVQFDIVWYQWDMSSKDYHPVPPLSGILS